MRRARHRTAARRAIQTSVDIAELSGSPGSASVHPATFLNKMHTSSLWVTRLPKDTLEGAQLRKEYSELFQAFPHDTVLKQGEDQMRTTIGKAKAVVNLEKKHSGEIVEMDRMKMTWILRPVTPGSASVEWSQQWNCKADGSPTDTPQDPEYGYPRAQDSIRQMLEQIQRVQLETGLERGALVPWAGANYADYGLRIIGLQIMCIYCFKSKIVSLACSLSIHIYIHMCV